LDKVRVSWMNLFFQLL